jgi:hypothetical protein
MVGSAASSDACRRPHWNANVTSVGITKAWCAATNAPTSLDVVSPTKRCARPSTPALSTRRASRSVDMWARAIFPRPALREPQQRW